MSDIYGIDLGTTNSLIGLNGTLIGGLTPSIADLKNKRAGESERTNYEAERGFKTNMSMSIAGAMPIAASCEVLKELKRVAGVSDKHIKAVVSVPAYFNQSQRQATLRAADKAGIEVVSLINEPTAAAIYIGKHKPGVSVIFDLGGGTFDISVIESSPTGEYRVLATDGCILGGNNLDSAIQVHFANQTERPWAFVADKSTFDLATRAKHELTDFPPPEESVQMYNGKPLRITSKDYQRIMKNTFAKALTLTKAVIFESGINIQDAAFYFVGGSTKCPYLREWIQNELDIIACADSMFDPDLTVALGACYYAQLFERGQAAEKITDVSKVIGFDRGDGIMEVLISKNSNIPFSNETIHIQNITADTLNLRFYQGDSIFVDECEEIGQLSMPITTKDADNNLVFGITTSMSTSGVITLKCFEILGEPTEVTMKGC